MNRQSLVRIAMSITGNMDDAEDAVQAVIARTLEHTPDVRDALQFLKVAVRNEAIELYDVGDRVTIRPEFRQTIQSSESFHLWHTSITRCKGHKIKIKECAPTDGWRTFFNSYPVYFFFFFTGLSETTLAS